MTNRRDDASPDALVLTHALEKLRMRDGVTYARLENGRSGEAAPLFGLASVRRYAAVHNIDVSKAVVAVIVECVRDGLLGTRRMVADAVLALGMFSDDYKRHGIDPRTVAVLQFGLLGRRRDALLSHWRVLHHALDLTPIQPPSDRALRGTIEPEILRELARQLIRREEYSFGSMSVDSPATPENSHEKSRSSEERRGRVIVIGGVAMDATFRTNELPATGTSREASSFDLRPGGKGLQQAVAAARLGLDVSLVAAVADDRYGQEIVTHLQDAGVDTSLIRPVNAAHTPFTGVIEFELGDSIAVNWRNQREVRLDPRDVRELEQQIAECDAVLLTFEIPRDLLEQTLAVVNMLDEPRPMVIVTPGQPYAGRISGNALSQIDYLVAHAWELGKYAPPGQARFDVDATARQLLTYGVETLCVLGPGCNVYSQTLGIFTVPTLATNYLELSAARDAFCAALAAKLIDRHGTFDEDVALWAAAAMTAANADHPLPNPMPNRRRVDQLMERSRFNLAPRTELVSDALAAAAAEPEQRQFPL
jgi:ribokinase